MSFGSSAGPLTKRVTTGSLSGKDKTSLVHQRLQSQLDLLQKLLQQ